MAKRDNPAEAADLAGFHEDRPRNDLERLDSKALKRYAAAKGIDLPSKGGKKAYIDKILSVTHPS